MPTHGEATSRTDSSPGAAAGEEAGRTVLRAVCWGTRGSVPSPGPATTRFGGNTSCLEIVAGERRYIFDAGTGIRVLGNRLTGEGSALDVDLFLTHFHWDHIQGLPFFAPLHGEGTTMRIHGARQQGMGIEELLRRQMGPVFFPVPYESVAAQLAFQHLSGTPWDDGIAEVAAYRVRHPADTYGFRIRSGGVSVAYVPDNELVGSRYEVDGPDWYAGLVEFLKGVDLCVHDAMFTDDEYPGVEGWGHSTYSQAVRLAEDAGVKQLLFFHHAPERSDDHLLRILEGARAGVERRGTKLELGAAEEGVELLVSSDRGGGEPTAA